MITGFATSRNQVLNQVLNQVYNQAINQGVIDRLIITLFEDNFITD